MRIPTRIYYGIRLMVNLALNYGKGQIFLKDIAKAEDISEKYLSQIIIPLKAGGFIDSVRGAHGGYMLNKPPVKINIKEVIETVQGNLDFTEKNNGRYKNSKTLFCVNSLIWKKLGSAVSQTFEAINLSDLIVAYSQNKENGIMYNI